MPKPAAIISTKAMSQDTASVPRMCQNWPRASRLDRLIASDVPLTRSTTTVIGAANVQHITTTPGTIRSTSPSKVSTPCVNDTRTSVTDRPGDLIERAADADRTVVHRVGYDGDRGADGDGHRESREVRDRVAEGPSDQNPRDLERTEQHAPNRDERREVRSVDRESRIDDLDRRTGAEHWFAHAEILEVSREGTQDLAQHTTAAL